MSRGFGTLPVGAEVIVDDTTFCAPFVVTGSDESEAAIRDIVARVPVPL